MMFRSVLILLSMVAVTGCDSDEKPAGGSSGADSASDSDGGDADASDSDGGDADASDSDGGDADASDSDGGDADSPDTASSDAGTPDTATPDTATPDTAAPDTATPDTAAPDTGSTGGAPVEDSPPAITGVSISPADAYETTWLYCDAEGADPDGDALSFTYAWMVNDLSVSDDSSLSGEHFNKGDAVTCTATLSAGGLPGGSLTSEAVVILNSVPTVTEVVLSPETPTAISELSYALSDPYDADYDSVSSTVQWYINDEMVGDEETLMPGMHMRGDTVRADVVLFDGTDSSMVYSVEVVIGDSPSYDDDGDGFSEDDGDCDDSSTLIDGATEICGDGIDNDCNPATIDLFDGDGDGSDCSVDCDDADATAFPGAAELCADGINNDCDDTTPDVFDADVDTYDCTIDCNDSDYWVNPGVVEVCADGVDNDCNSGTVDYFDGDGDGSDCSVDCDDGDSTSYPGAVELCADGTNNDCDSATPDVFDADSDGHMCNVDCNDSDSSTYPGAPEELCDGMDNDCDGVVPEDETTDNDFDGYYACDDCNDMDSRFHPFAVELCDGQDNDCDGVVPDSEIDNDGDRYVECEGWVGVEPGIDWGSPDCIHFSWPFDFSVCPEIGVVAGGDCDDGSDLVYPGATETCDGKDNDCNPDTDENADTDGDGYSICTGDCYPTNGSVHPGAGGWGAPYTTESGSTSYDYNCDGVETLEWPNSFYCESHWLPGEGTCNHHDDGWDGGAPACGESKAWLNKCTTDWAFFYGLADPSCRGQYDSRHGDPPGDDMFWGEDGLPPTPTQYCS
jgi:hypothetical protein